jgi:probable HAF family extracellular repeat protein
VSRHVARAGICRNAFRGDPDVAGIRSLKDGDVPRRSMLAFALVLFATGATGQIVDVSGAPSTRSARPGWAIAELGAGTATAVNSSGQIIGNGCTAECAGWAVSWQNGKKTALVRHPDRDGAGSSAAAINDHGQVVGWTFTDSANPSNDKRHAFLWQSGKTTFLRSLADGNQSQASAINERGQVVGWVETGSGARHAALWQSGGALSDLGTLGGRTSNALAINERGQVVGWSETTAGDRHAFLWQEGTMRDLGTPGGKGSEAIGINDRRQIIGIGFPATASWGAPIPPVHAFFWENGKLTDLGRVAWIGWQLALNARGQVAGSRDDGNSGTAPPNPRHHRAFLWANGRLSFLPTPRGASGSNAYAVNDRGQVVGTCEFSLGSHACLWERGKVIDLGFLGPDDHKGTGAIARAINESGLIVGNSSHFMDFSHAVRWTPQTN